MRRRDGSNVWVERAVKVFRTRRHKPPPQHLLLTNGTNGIDRINGTNEKDSSYNDVLALTSSQDGEEPYQEEMELLFTTRSIPIN